MSPSTNEAEDAGIIRQALARHQRRRAQGIPTLTVLVGPPEEAVRTWRDWVGSMGWVEARVVRTEEDAGKRPSMTGATLYLCAAVGDAACSLVETVERISHFLTAQGTAQAGAVVGIAVERADAHAYLRAEPHSRAGALFAEGIVELATTLAATPDASLARTAASLADHGVKPETLAGFQTAAAARERATSAGAGQETDDEARSAAERFLFDLLDELPDTAGLFALNVRLGFCFGPMPAEVDLLAAGLQLAVEIDGFHHFREPECYRRDRRKDALLQKQGYLVLRFLAEDVVVRLEEILEEIRAAVAFRRVTRR